MDVIGSLLFWIHLSALGLGGAAAFGIPVVGMRIAGAPAETRPLLFKIADNLSNLGRFAILLLIVSGPLLLWERGVVPTTWFWVKMLLLVAFLAAVIYAGINAKRAEKGDLAAAKRAAPVSFAALGLFLLVILSAVLAFGTPV